MLLLMLEAGVKMLPAPMTHRKVVLIFVLLHVIPTAGPQHQIRANNGDGPEWITELCHSGTVLGMKTHSAMFGKEMMDLGRMGNAAELRIHEFQR